LAALFKPSQPGTFDAVGAVHPNINTGLWNMGSGFAAFGCAPE